MQTSKRWKQASKWQKRGFISAVIISFYAIFLGLIVPWQLKERLPDIAGDLLGGRELLIEDIRINPFTLSISIDQLVLSGLKNEQLAGFEYFYVNFQLSSLFRMMLTFDEITLIKPHGHIIIGKDKKLNIDDLLSPSESGITEKSDESEPEAEQVDKSAGIIGILIHNLSIQGLEAHFTDESKSKQFDASIGPLNVTLDGFTTRQDENTSYQLKAESASGVIGSKLVWDGQISIVPLSSTGKLNITDINLVKWWDYISDDVNFVVQSGLLDVAAEYAFDMSGDKPVVKVSNSSIVLDNMNVAAVDNDEALIALGMFHVSGVAYDSVKHQVDIMKVSLDDNQVIFELMDGGGNNLSPLFTGKQEEDTSATGGEPVDAESATEQVTEDEQEEGEIEDDLESGVESGVAVSDKNSEEEKSAPSAEEPELLLNINQIALNNNRLTFKDSTLENDAIIELSDINVSLSQFNLREGSEFPLALSLYINEAGKLNVAGKAGISPVNASLAVSLEGLPLQSIEPYLQDYTHLEIEDGQLTVKSDITLSINDDTTQVGVLGDVNIVNWKAGIANQEKDFMAFQALNINEVDFQLEPMRLNITTVELVEPNILALIDDKGVMNLGNIAKSSEASNEKIDVKDKSEKEGDNTGNNTGNNAAKEQSSPVINVDKVILQKANFRFEDYSVSPFFNIELNEFSGDIKEISSDAATKAVLNLNGKIDGYAPVVLNGEVNFLSEELYTDIYLTMKETQMSEFTPYTATYIGRKVDKGKLNLDLAYHIENNALKSKNNILLDQFTLGDHVESEKSANLPVGLAVSLLKNSKGEIIIDMPIEGNLDDPNFKYGKLVWKTLTGLIVKAAASPFMLLAGAVDGGEDLGLVQFDAGESDLTVDAEARLITLRDALAKKQDIKLEINGCYHLSKDSDVLKIQKINKKIGVQAGQLETESYLTLLEAYYKQTKGADIQYPAPSPEKPLTLVVKKAFIMGQLLLDEEVSENDLLALAQRRSQSIQHIILQDNIIGIERVFVGGVEIIAPGVESLQCAMKLN